jgi:hypothetical protein
LYLIQATNNATVAVTTTPPRVTIPCNHGVNFAVLFIGVCQFTADLEAQGLYRVVAWNSQCIVAGGRRSADGGSRVSLHCSGRVAPDRPRERLNRREVRDGLCRHRWRSCSDCLAPVLLLSDARVYQSIGSLIPLPTGRPSGQDPDRPPGKGSVNDTVGTQGWLSWYP